MKLRPVRREDAIAIADIYAPFVTECAISFETEVPDAAEILRRIGVISTHYPWYVAVDEQGAVAGYAYASSFRSRPAYRFAVETSVYVARDRHRGGIGDELYHQLLETLTRQGFTQAVAAIALPNEGSIRFHERHGFRHTGTYHQIGWKCDEWHDVGLWQRPLATPAGTPPEPIPFGLLPGT